MIANGFGSVIVVRNRFVEITGLLNLEVNDFVIIVVVLYGLERLIGFPRGQNFKKKFISDYYKDEQQAAKNKATNSSLDFSIR